MKTLWYTKAKYPAKALVLYKSSWWESHYKNCKFCWNFNWKGSPSKLHANVQILLLGWSKCNGACTFRLGNLNLTYRWG